MKNPNGYCNHRIRFKSWPYRPKSSYADLADVEVDESAQ